MEPELHPTSGGSTTVLSDRGARAKTDFASVYPWDARLNLYPVLQRSRCAGVLNGRGRTVKPELGLE